MKYPTPDFVRVFCDWVRRGYPSKDAAALSGHRVPESLLRLWLRVGRPVEDGPEKVPDDVEGHLRRVYYESCLHFHTEYLRARAEFHGRHIDNLERGAEEDPRLSLKILGIRDSVDWQESPKVLVNNNSFTKDDLVSALRSASRELRSCTEAGDA
jgi:hypothetical protein